jgi:hypothetical protein
MLKFSFKLLDLLLFLRKIVAFITELPLKFLSLD